MSTHYSWQCRTVKERRTDCWTQLWDWLPDESTTQCTGGSSKRAVANQMHSGHDLQYKKGRRRDKRLHEDLNVDRESHVQLDEAQQTPLCTKTWPWMRKTINKILVQRQSDIVSRQKPTPSKSQPPDCRRSSIKSNVGEKPERCRHWKLCLQFMLRMPRVFRGESDETPPCVPAPLTFEHRRMTKRCRQTAIIVASRRITLVKKKWVVRNDVK